MPIFCQIWYRTFLGANQNCNCRFHDHDGQSLQILYTEQTHYIHVTLTKILFTRQTIISMLPLLEFFLSLSHTFWY